MKCLTWILWKRTKSQPILLNSLISTDLLDVSGSVCCTLRCLSLLTHHLHRCLLETLQSLFLSSSQAVLHFYMSLNKISIDIIYTQPKKKKKAHPSTNISGGSKAKWSTVYVRKSQMINSVCEEDCTGVYPGQFLPVFLQLQLHLQRFPLSLDLQFVKVALVALLLRLQGQSLNKRVNTSSQNWHYHGWVLLEFEDKHKSLLNIYYWTFYAA